MNEQKEFIQQELERLRKEKLRRELAAVKAEKARRGNNTASTEDLRKDVGTGMTLRPFGIDTDIEMPQGVAEFLAGAGKRLRDIGTLGTAEPEPYADALLDDSGYAAFGGGVADAASMIAGGTGLKLLGAGAGLAGAGRTAKALSAAGKALQTPDKFKSAVAAPTAYGALTSQERLEGAGAGAFGGAAGYGAGRLMGWFLKPSVQKSAQELMENDVQLTVGETFGGLAQRVEDGMTSWIGVGDMIKNAKRLSMRSFNKSILNKVLEPLQVELADDGSFLAGKALSTTVKNQSWANHQFQALNKLMPEIKDQVGGDAVDAIQDMLSVEYQTLLPKMNARLDMKFMSDLSRLNKMAQDMTENNLKRWNRVLNNHVYRYINEGNPQKVILGETMKDIDSSLGRMAWGAKKAFNATVEEREFADAVFELQRVLRKNVERSNPDLAPHLRNLDQAWHRLRIVQDAATSGTAIANDGVFTPHQLVGAIKRAFGRRRVRSGTFYKEAKAGMQTLPPTVPDSGTPTRMITAGLAAGIGGVGIHPGVAVAGLGGMAAYSKPGQDVARLLLAKRLPWMLQSGEAVGKLAGPLSVAGGAGMLNQ